MEPYVQMNFECPDCRGKGTVSPPAPRRYSNGQLCELPAQSDETHATCRACGGRGVEKRKVGVSELKALLRS